MKTVEELRMELDGIDSELMRLFEKRMELADEIGAAKRAGGMPVFDPEREEQVVSTRTALLSGDMRSGGEKLMRLLIEESKRVQRRGLNLYLIGMPDCGKTRMGKRLCGRLSMPLADTDGMIVEKTGMSIETIFARFGEEGFREIEAAALRAVAAHGGLIVATGGGLPLWGDNPRILKNSGVTVFLDRSLDKLRGQSTRGRPLLAAPTREETDEKIERLYYERHEKYLACADMTLDPDSGCAAERIAEAYNKLTNHGDSPRGQ